MAKNKDARGDLEAAALQEELADARAQIDSLQGQAADAEARAATLGEENARLVDSLSEAKAALDAANAELNERGERAAALEGELEAGRQEAEALQGSLREAALKYREARLAAASHIPVELVTGETLAEIDEQLEAAGRVVSQVRDKLQEESQSARRPVPLGSPTRRGPDVSALSPQEKIKLGLQERERR